MTAARTEDDAPRGFVPKSEHYRALAKIAELEERLSDLQRTIGWDRDATVWLAARVRLSPTEAKFLALLLSRDAPVCSKTVLAMVWQDGGGDLSSVRVYAWKLRQRIAAAGGPQNAINAIWGVGYQITPEGRAWLKERIPELFDKGAAR